MLDFRLVSWDPRRQMVCLVAAALLTLILLACWGNHRDVTQIMPSSLTLKAAKPCNDVLIVMKTGANESQDV